MVSHEVEQLSVVSEDAGDLRIAEARRAVRDGVKDRLDIRRRAGDHAQNLARRRLLLEGLRQGALHVRIRRCWLGTRFEALKRCTALSAELVGGGIVLLAPGTVHGEASQHAGPGTVGQVARE